MHKVGFFYHAGGRHRNVIASYTCLKQLRSVYSDAPISMWEDTYHTDASGNYLYPLEEIGKLFDTTQHKCSFDTRYPDKTYPAIDLYTHHRYADKIFYALTHELSECEWIMNFEDDVFILKNIESFPDSDFCGQGGSNLMMGGTVFKREAFLTAHEGIEKINWPEVRYGNTIWTDNYLPFIMESAGFINSSPWKEHSAYRPNHESEKNSVSVLHGVKYFYKTPYGVLESEEEDYKNLSSIIQRPEIARFLSKYDITCFND